MEYTIIIALLAVLIFISVINLVKNGKKNDFDQEFEKLSRSILSQVEKSNKSTLDFVNMQNKSSAEAQSLYAQQSDMLFKAFSRKTESDLAKMNKAIGDMSLAMEERLSRFQKQNTDSLELVRATLEKKVGEMQAGNEKKLEEMRRTVDEKLQKTLEDRISQSFKLVSERLEQVYKSLGEMQKVGAGVEDLRKVLSNVKTRGILGEVQLGAILEEILTPGQYEVNIATKKGSADRVEYAVKMPGIDGSTVYLPIDAKFPLDAYRKLMDAYDSANPDAVQQALKEMMQRIKSFAKDIRTKYIDVPNTTDFAIMFLPVEGLYAEVVRHGMVEELQKEKINIAGPTTMAALLNSLQMGFRTLAIQQTSGQVWKVLQEVKTEFEKFGDALEKTQNRMKQASEELDKLVGTRTNAINRKLRSVSEYTPIDGIETSAQIAEKTIDIL